MRPLFHQNILVMSFLYVLLFSLGNILFIPGWIFLAASVYELGTFWGFSLTLLAAYVSVILGYFIIGSIGDDVLRKTNKPFLNKMIKNIEKRPFWVVVILRLVFQTAPFLNYALALSGVPFRYYLLGSVVALPPVVFLYAFFIKQLVEVL